MEHNLKIFLFNVKKLDVYVGQTTILFFVTKTIKHSTKTEKSFANKCLS